MEKYPSQGIENRVNLGNGGLMDLSRKNSG